MAGNSVIGALRVDLGLNSAQFTQGLKNAQKGLGTFGKTAALGFAAVATAATAAAMALAPVIKSAIDHADALAKSAQKAGTTVEALSRLEFAAKLSDISLESLTSGLQKLGKSMSDAIITPTSTAATAFKALGIELKNSDGTMRNSDAVLADIADRFSRLEDGSTKTALAMQIFGKSGAELIPLLNSGRDGLKSMADESDRLGATISTKTAKAAEEFNDTLTRVQTIMQGVVNKVAEAVLPALQDLADVLASPQFATSAQTLATNIVTAMATVLEWIADVKTKWNDLVQFIHHGVLADIVNKPPVSTNIEDRRGESSGLHPLTGAAGQLLLNTTFGLTGDKTHGSVSDMWEALTPPKIVFEDLSATRDAAKAVDDQLKAMNADLALQRERWEELQQPVKETMDTISSGLSSAMSGLISDLIKGKDAVGGLINAFGNLGDRLIQMAMDQAIQGLLGSLFGAAFGGVGSSLGMPFSSGLGRGLTGAAVYGTGGGFYGVPSFDGGGFTGYGARGGGMDGKGGFMAMLHPDETVLDHSKGQGGPVMNFEITGSRQDAAAIANLVEQKVSAGIRAYMKNPDRI